jgi:hypothetical protein
MAEPYLSLRTTKGQDDGQSLFSIYEGMCFPVTYLVPFAIASA